MKHVSETFSTSIAETNPDKKKSQGKIHSKVFQKRNASFKKLLK